MELFLVRIFPHSDWIRREMKYLSVFSPNTGKYGPEITLYFDNFQAVYVSSSLDLDMAIQPLMLLENSQRKSD